MTQVFRQVADTALKLSPEERLALTAALDLSLDDETRAGALADAVKEGAEAISRGESVMLNSSDELKGFLDGCLREARQEIEEGNH